MASDGARKGMICHLKIGKCLLHSAVPGFCVFRLNESSGSVKANTAVEELLKQIWINLIDNAIKFSPEYGELNIKIIQTNDVLSVSIVNPGTPIPGDKQDRIFQKFYQADESHATEGNGIGLAVAKKVA